MATITVTTAADKVASDGLRSLREAVAQANATAAADTIVFASSLEGKTLTLTQGELVLRQDATIDGDQNNDGKEVTLSGGDRSRILHIAGGGTDAQLRDLTLTHGGGGSGGAIYAEYGTNLTLIHTTVTGNNANYDGGGIFGFTMTLTNSTVSGNSVAGYGGRGGGIVGDVVTLTNSTVSGNSMAGNNVEGGGVSANTVTLTNSTVSGNSLTGYGTSGGGLSGETVTLTNSTISGNSAYSGGGIHGRYVSLTSSTVSDNTADFSGGIYAYAVTLTTSTVSGNSAVVVGGIDGQVVTVTNSTVSGNSAEFRAGGILGGDVTLTNSTVSGNSAEYYGGGIRSFRIAHANNSIIAGNSAVAGLPDIEGTVISNGHNIFGSDVNGAIIGDLQGIAPSLLFGAIDPATGGGQLNSDGVIPLRNNVDNPALSGGDPLAALSTDQLGHLRPQPAGSLPDIGAAERSQTLSTHLSPNNDVLTGTDAANTILGHAGADLIRGLGGNDTLRGEEGSDVLDGGSGNDLLDGGDGINLARFGGSTAVIVDIVAGTATRGMETDTLTGIQGAIGSSAADTFRGDGGPNWFQGGGGRDVAAGGAASDLYDYDRTGDSLPGSANRDVINDFVSGSDKIDLTGIDANTAVAGNQAFVWLDASPLTGAGQVDFITSGGNTIVQASTDADSTPELQIRLTGSVTLSEGDFFCDPMCTTVGDRESLTWRR